MVNLPKSWDEVYMDQFIDIKQLGDDCTYFLRGVQILSILTDTLEDDEMWEDMDIDDISDILKELKWLRQTPSNSKIEQFDEYRSIDINSLTFGEWIDLEYYFQDYFTNLDKISAIMYRKWSIDEWGEIILQKNGTYNLENRANSFMEMPITRFFWLINYYLEFKKMITSTYEVLFEPQIVEDDEEVEYDDEEQEEIRKEEAFKKWSWETILNKFADGDITKYDEILNMPIVFIFNQLSFKKEMNL